MGAALAERMTTENDDDRDRFLRLAADFENFRKRVQQDRLETLKYGAATIVQRLLPVLDDAERADAPPAFQPGCQPDGRSGCPPSSALRGLDPLRLGATIPQGRAATRLSGGTGRRPPLPRPARSAR
jgi:hypothetical protein